MELGPKSFLNLAKVKSNIDFIYCDASVNTVPVIGQNKACAWDYITYLAKQLNFSDW